MVPRDEKCVWNNIFKNNLYTVFAFRIFSFLWSSAFYPFVHPSLSTFYLNRFKPFGSNDMGIVWNYWHKRRAYEIWILRAHSRTHSLLTRGQQSTTSGSGENQNQKTWLRPNSACSNICSNSIEFLIIINIWLRI
jgi:hypothetical protein